VKALMKTRKGPGHIELRDIPEPRPRRGEVVLDVECAGICGTDLHIVRDEFPYWPPVVLGHEFTGRVTGLGAGVDKGWLGRLVVCEPHAGACGQCYLCRRGCSQLCADKRSPGWGVNGAFARQVAVPAALLHGVPEDVPAGVAVLAEPMAIGLSGLERAPVRPGDTVLVTGPGPVGILSAMAARFAGAKAVIVIGRPGASPERLAVAARLGLPAVTDPGAARELILDASGGRGADLLIEASGSAQAFAAGLDLVRSRARVVALGLSGRESVSFPWDLAMRKSVDVSFSLSSSYTAWDPALVVLARYAKQAAGLVTEFPLDRWADAFDAIERRTVLKAALRPSPM
jgi:L-iditol 2-dehydrogenase